MDTNSLVFITALSGIAFTCLAFIISIIISNKKTLLILVTFAYGLFLVSLVIMGISVIQYVWVFKTGNVIGKISVLFSAAVVMTLEIGINSFTFQILEGKLK